MNVTFYINNSDELKVGKSLSLVKTVPCSLKDNATLLNPVIELSRDTLPNWTRINYMYIDTFGRYYFVDPQSTAEAGGMVMITGRIDYLGSNAAAIGNLSCLVLRQEHLYNKYYQDAELNIRSQKSFIYKSVGSLPDVKTYLLTVDGGKR